MPGSSQRRAARQDALLCLALFAVAVAYLLRLPRLLGPSDEGLFLYAARRLLAGEVFYRDIFEIITPGAQYLMAGAFAVFGISIATAKATDAVVHGLIVAVTFLICRQLGVRRSLSAVAALAHLAVDQPAWPYASPHWVSTMLTMLLVLLTLARPWQRRAAGAALPGLVAGAMIAVQHQKGVVFAGVVGVCLLLDGWLGTRRAMAGPAASLAWLCAGVAAVAAPFLGVLIAAAGARAVYAALVEFPLVNYRSYNRVAWGAVPFLTVPLVPNTFPRLLKFLPAVTGLLPLRAGLVWRAVGRSDAHWRLAALAAFAAASVLSIAYFPDFVHLAFIAPIFYAVGADSAEAALRAATRRVAAVAPAAALCAALVVGVMAWHLRGNLRRQWAAYPVAADTAIGRIDFPNRATAATVERVRALADADPQRRLFCYPAYPALYLMTETDNPTPFQILVRDYSPAEQFTTALAILAARQAPLVYILPPYVGAGDPVINYVHAHYDQLPDEPALWVLRADPPPSGGA